MGRRVGDDAWQVRGPGVRRRTDRPRRAGGFGQHPGADRKGWRADNTDVDGIIGALGQVSGRAAVVGSGGTAPPLSSGWQSLACRIFRSSPATGLKAGPLVGLAAQVGAQARWIELGAPVGDVDVVVSTIPADVAAAHVETLAATPVLLDAIYDPWPTPLAAAVESAGGRVISGLEMLLNQAFAQVEQFTGLPAPKEAMRAAIADR